MSAVVLAILVLTGEAQRPELTAALSAASDVAGTAGAVRVVERPKVSDAEALRIEGELRVAAVVQVTWRDPNRLRARVRLHAARTDRWLDRELRFVPEDSPQERGRTLGFAIASMLPEGDPELQIRQTQPIPPEAPASRPLARHAVGASLAAGAGLGGPGGGIGASVGADTFLTERASVGLKLATRGGRISEVDATSVTALVGAGATFWWVVPDGVRPFGLGARADVLLLLHAVSRTGPGGGTQWKSHVLPGADLGLEATWRLAQAVDLVLAGGLEVAFGTVDVTVVAAPPANGRATIPALRAVAALGVRMRF